jgi:hypothetical protein
VAAFRSQAGRNPYDRNLQDLIGELSTRSDEFRVRWAAHNVRYHRTGTKRLHHPIVGKVELSYETLTLDADDGLRLALYTATASTPARSRIRSSSASLRRTTRRPPRVMLCWGRQQGRSVIPKSTKAERIAENIDVFDVELTGDELAAIDGLNTSRRGGPEPDAITLEAFGRDIPEA